MSRFISVRNRRLSLWQSSVTAATARLQLSPERKEVMRHAAGLHAQSDVNGTGMVAPPSPLPGEPRTLAYHVQASRLHFRWAELLRRGDTAAAVAAGDAARSYSSGDPAWIECITQYTEWYDIENKPPVYIDWTKQNPPVDISTFAVIPWQIPNDAQVLVIGDWGTNMTDNQQMVVQALGNPLYNRIAAIVHLGDVYYAGTPAECTTNIVNALPQIFAQAKVPPIPFFAIPGNHEYYSGGQGFYTMLTALANPKGCQQQASYFCLRTQDDTWQFVGMDTGVNDHNADMDALGTLGLNPLAVGPAVTPTEVQWVADKLNNFGGNTLLLSHHQLFSSNAAINGWATSEPAYLNTGLYDTFLPFFGKICAWLWGHEHNFAYYQDGTLGLNKGRLLGCSAYEESSSASPYAVNYPQIPCPTGMQEVTTTTQSDGTYYNHALAVVDFQRASSSDPIQVTYCQYPSWGTEPTPPPTDLTVLYTESIGAPVATPQFVWIGNQQISTSSGSPESNAGPSVALFNDTLYMAYKGEFTTDLCLSQFDGSSWSGNQEISSMSGNISPQSSDSPALAVFNGLLYMTYTGAMSDSIYVAVFDGATWSGNTVISIPGGNPESNYGPQLAVYDNQLFMVYKGAHSNDLYYATFDGVAWSGNQQIITSNGNPESTQPAAVAVYTPEGSNPMLYIAYAGESTGNLYFSWFDGANWYGNTTVTTTNGTPASNACPWMAPVGGRLLMLYKGYISDTIYTAELANGSWSGNQPLVGIAPESNMTGSIVPYGGGLYMVYKGAHSNALYEAQCVVTGSTSGLALARAAGN